MRKVDKASVVTERRMFKYIPRMHMKIYSNPLTRTTTTTYHRPRLIHHSEAMILPGTNEISPIQSSNY